MPLKKVGSIGRKGQEVGGNFILNGFMIFTLARYHYDD
jgi:hypothetical protein